MAERMVRTVKENTTKVNRYQNVSQAIQDFKKFQNYHNLQRKLKLLQNRTPYERMIGWYEKKPELFIYQPTHRLSFGKKRGRLYNYIIKLIKM